MCTLTSARAQEVQIGVEQGVDVENNVFNSAANPTTDGRYRVTPTLEIAQPESDLTYRLEYRPTWTGYFRSNGLNGLDHFVAGQGRYQLDGRNAVSGDVDFIRIRNIRETTFLDAAGITQSTPTVRGETQRFNTNLRFDRSLDATTAVSLGLNYNRWDYFDSNQVSNQGYGAVLQLTRALNGRTFIGGNVDLRYRAFEGTLFSPPSSSTILNANALLSFDITPRLSLFVSGGPAGVFARQTIVDTQTVTRWAPFNDPALCPTGPCGRAWSLAPIGPSLCGTFDGDEILTSCSPVSFNESVPGFPDDTKTVPVVRLNAPESATDALTYFVSAVLNYEFRIGSVRLVFSRNEDGGGGVGATTIRNSGQVIYNRPLSDRWRLQLLGTYWVRESVSQVPVSLIEAERSAQVVTTALGDQVFLAEASQVIATQSARTFKQSVGYADVTLVRQLTEHSRLRFRFRYYNQSIESVTASGPTAFDKFTGGIFFDYEFDPYKL